MSLKIYYVSKTYRAIAWSTALQIAKRNFSVGLYKKPRRKNIWDNDEVLKND